MKPIQKLCDTNLLLNRFERKQSGHVVVIPRLVRLLVEIIHEL